MNNKNPPNDAQLLAAMRDLVKVQQANQAVKEKELDLERKRIESNEKIALASIEAQKGDRDQQITTISKLHSQRHILIGVVVIIIAIIVIVAMYTNNTDFALEMLKIGGALLAGYWAGFGRGKASILEKQQDEE
jgi:membrane protein